MVEVLRDVDDPMQVYFSKVLNRPLLAISDAVTSYLLGDIQHRNHVGTVHQRLLSETACVRAPRAEAEVAASVPSEPRTAGGESGSRYLKSAPSS